MSSDGDADANPFAVTPDALTLPFWEAARRAEFVLPRCDVCERFHFYPKPLCPFCGSPRLSWRVARPTGRLTAVTLVHRPPAPYFAAGTPYALGIATLDEGPSLFSAVVGDAGVGDRVALVFRDRGGEWPVPAFEPAAR